MGACSSLEDIETDNFTYDNSGHKINKQLYKEGIHEYIVDAFYYLTIYYIKRCDDYVLFLIRGRPGIFIWIGNNFPDNIKKKDVISFMSYITKICNGRTLYLVKSMKNDNKIIKPQLMYERV
jgi:hypothetical protein